MGAACGPLCFSEAETLGHGASYPSLEGPAADNLSGRVGGTRKLIDKRSVDTHNPPIYTGSPQRGCSSEGEHLLCTQGARGSNPLTSTTQIQYRCFLAAEAARPGGFSFCGIDCSHKRHGKRSPFKLSSKLAATMGIGPVAKGKRER